MSRFQSIAAAGLAAVWLSTGAAAAQVVLKLATLAPEGSIWMQALNDARAEIETATAGAVKLKIYPGGIMGSEKDVLFKIKTGQLQGGGFMGYAIGKVCPEASALMFPMVFRGYEEVEPTPGPTVSKPWGGPRSASAMPSARSRFPTLRPCAPPRSGASIRPC